MRTILLTLAAFALTACNTSEQTKRIDTTSLPSALVAAANQVRVIPEGGDYNRLLGSVQGFSCKRMTWDPPASKGAALQQLRIKAHQLGANAVTNVAYDERGTDTWGTNCWESVTASGDAVIR
ncbi:MAG: heavy metal-binding domain-containing protein [Pseudomonadota bacterium]|nr:heavy metal-binding domain-containing protein [Pseudomonadota bacterium]